MTFFVWSLCVFSTIVEIETDPCDTIKYEVIIGWMEYTLQQVPHLLDVAFITTCRSTT